MFEEKMDKAISVMEEDFSNVRVGRANPKLLNKVEVSYYGTPTAITSVASVAVPEPRMLLVSPFDANSLADIEKAIIDANLGLTPSNDGKVIRIVFPPLTEERRKEISKELSAKAENTKIAIRNVRRDGMESYKKQKKDNEITEDDLKRKEDELQKLTDKKVHRVDEILEAKTKEVLEV